MHVTGALVGDSLMHDDHVGVVEPSLESDCHALAGGRSPFRIGDREEPDLVERFGYRARRV